MTTPDFGMGTMQRFVEHIRMRQDYIVGGNNDNQLGVTDTELTATFAFPWFNNIKTPFLISPGFGFHFWQGPVSLPATPPDFIPPADMPPVTYDAFLDTAWNPWFTDAIGAELDFRIGLYSDFTVLSSNSFRYTGRGMAVIKLSPSMTLKAGVWYLDRVRVKILPAGGLVWTPNPDVRFDILFPNPKLAKKISNTGNVEWWLYGRGEYGGGTWSIKRDTGLVPPGPMDGQYDSVDYNDIRIALGLDFKTRRQMEGNLEVGLSCARELVYQSGLPGSFVPVNTVYFGFGLAR